MKTAILLDINELHKTRISQKYSRIKSEIIAGIIFENRKKKF